MWIPSVEAALVGGLLCLDRVVLNIMLSRPVVAGPVIGFVLGDPVTGLTAGAMTELLWIDRFHMGRDLPPNDTVVAVLVAAGSILAGRSLGGPSPEIIAAAVLLFAPAALVAQRADMSIAVSNDRLSDRAAGDARRGDVTAIARKQYFGMAKTFLVSSVLILVLLGAGTVLLKGIVPHLPERLLATLTLLYYGIPVIGISVALSTIKIRGALPVFAGLFLLVLIVVRLW